MYTKRSSKFSSVLLAHFKCQHGEWRPRRECVFSLVHKSVVVISECVHACLQLCFGRPNICIVEPTNHRTLEKDILFWIVSKSRNKLQKSRWPLLLYVIHNDFNYIVDTSQWHIRLVQPWEVPLKLEALLLQCIFRAVCIQYIVLLLLPVGFCLVHVIMEPIVNQRKPQRERPTWKGQHVFNYTWVGIRE